MPTEIDSLQVRERRQFPRQMVKSLAYLDIGPDNGGIVLNISETGLAVHAVSVLPSDPVLGLRLQLPRSARRLEAKAKVAWTSETKKDAGVEFVDLDEEARIEIKQWLASENLPPVYTESAPASEPPPPPRPNRTDKWTSLVSQMASAPEGLERAVVVPDSMPLRTVVDSEPPPEIVASPPPDALAQVASNDSAPEMLEGGVGIAETATNEDTELLAQLSAPPEPTPAMAPEEPKEDFVSDALSEDTTGNADGEFPLPTDAMLPPAARRPFSIVPNRTDKTGAGMKAPPSRASGTTAAQEDDFLKKARELFGPKRGLREEQTMRGSSPAVNPPLEPALAIVSQEEVTHDDVPPLPLAQSGALDPAPLRESPVPDSRETAASSAFATPLPTPHMLPRAAEPKSTAARPSRRGTDPLGMLGIFALCLTLSVACLGLGIVVGRNAALRSRNFASGADAGTAKAPSQPVTSDSLNSSSSTSGPASHGPNRPSIRERLGRGQQLRPASKANQRDGDNSDSSQNATDNSASSDPQLSESSAAPAQTTAAPAAAAPRPSPVVPRPSDSTVQTQPLSERLVPAHLIYRVEPFYPRAALQQRVEGTVRIRAAVGKDGRATNLRVISGPAPLTAAALDAAQYWRYIPALKNGEPVETEEEISIEFHLTR